MSGRAALVTGAGGFVCRHIVEALLVRGWHVLALDRAFDSALRAQWAGRVVMIEGDAAQPPSLPVEVLVHGAALTATPEEAGLTPEAYLREHLNTALDLLAWADAERVRRVLLVSSDAVFRETPAGLLDEDAPVQPVGLYAIAKAALEHLAHTLRAEYGRDIAAIRLGSIYGYGELARPSRPHISRVGRMIQQALHEGQVTIDMNMPVRSWTYAPDIGAAACALLEAPVLRHALYNVASEETLLPGMIAQVFRAELPGIRIIEEWGAPSLDKRRHTLSSRRLREDVGFAAWTPFAQGIANTLTWHHAHTEVLP